MKAEVFAHLTQRIISTSTKTDPYHHFHAEQIFPEEFYRELIENIPDISYFSQLDAYPQRSCFALLKEKLEQLPFTYFLFWHNFITSIGGLSFANALLKKFQPQLKKRFGENIPLTKMGVDLSLIRDQAGYSIGPHTDHPSKILTLIFYLPLSQEQNHLGTSIYVPKDGSRKYSGHEHHSFKEFDKVYRSRSQTSNLDSARQSQIEAQRSERGGHSKTMADEKERFGEVAASPNSKFETDYGISTIPFVPNSVFGFLRSDCSFHGVEPIQTQEKERISLCYTIWEQK